MSDPYETTEQHLERLLRCALNSFDLSDTTVDRLGTALAHSSALHSSHHSSVLHRETYRHSYLLSDGTTLTLWELVHGGGKDVPSPAATSCTTTRATPSSPPRASPAATGTPPPSVTTACGTTWTRSPC